MVWLTAEEGDGLHAVFTLQSHMQNNEEHRTQGGEHFQLGREKRPAGRAEWRENAHPLPRGVAVLQQPGRGTVDIYRLRAPRHPVAAGRAGMCRASSTVEGSRLSAALTSAAAELLYIRPLVI